MALGINKQLLVDEFGPGGAGGDRLKIMHGDIAFDNSYPSNGEALDLSNEFNDLKLVIFEAKLGYVFEYDYTNKKVIAYYYDYDATADGPAIECANTTDLSALTSVKFIAYGY